MNALSALGYGIAAGIVGGLLYWQLAAPAALATSRAPVAASSSCRPAPHVERPRHE